MIPMKKLRYFIIVGMLLLSFNLSAVAQEQAQSDLGISSQTGLGNILAALQRQTSCIYNVKNYGAIGDGITDDAAAIQATIDTAEKAPWGIVMFPAGTYFIRSALKPVSFITMMGVGIGSKILQASGTNFNMLESKDRIYHLTITNLRLDGNHAGKIGINMWLDHSILDHLFIENFAGDGINMNDPKISDALAFLNVIRYCHIGEVNGKGIYLHYPCTDSWIIYNNIGSENTDIYTEGGPFRIIGNHLDGSPLYNYYNAGGQDTIFTDNICENASLHSIYMVHNPWDKFEEGWCITNNIIRNGSRGTNLTYDFVHLEGISSISGGFVTISNNLFNYASGNRTRYAIYVKYFNNVIIANNCFNSDSYAKSPVGLDIGTNKIRISGNTNNQYSLLNNAAPIINGTTSGTATISGGLTSIIVMHQLGETPSAPNIIISPLNNLGNATKYWVSNITNTSFTINVNVAQFAWQAKIE
jgi:hypothetical protein